MTSIPGLNRIKSDSTFTVRYSVLTLDMGAFAYRVLDQPSYYHFHIHAAAISHDGGGGQAAGKAILLQNVISQLDSMAGGEEVGFANVELTYIVGEESELWQNVFSKLKK